MIQAYQGISTRNVILKYRAISINSCYGGDGRRQPAAATSKRMSAGGRKHT